MKVTAEKHENNMTELTIEVPAAELDKAIEKAYRKLANQVNVPGFRKGKVPRKILEARVGKQALLAEAFDIIVPGAYSKAVEEQKIDVVGRPEVEIVTLQESEPLVFKAKVATKPEITLGEYKGLQVKEVITEISEDDVDKQIKTLQDRHAKMVVAEDAELAMGDFAIIDFDGTIDGVPFSGGQSKGYPLQLGSGSFIPGFEEQLVGARLNDEREVSVQFPEEYFVKELAGKNAKFAVKINDIKRREIPEVDDDFVKEASEVATVEELRSQIKNSLTEAAKQNDEKTFRGQAVKQAVENVQVDLPEVMIEEKIDHMIQDLEDSLQGRGLTLEKYLGYINTDVKGLREHYREAAIEEIKTELVLEAIAKQEVLTVSDEDFDKEVERMATAYKVPVENVKKMLGDPSRSEFLKEGILRRKAFDLIVEQAVKV